MATTGGPHLSSSGLAAATTTVRGSRGHDTPGAAPPSRAWSPFLKTLSRETHREGLPAEPGGGQSRAGTGLVAEVWDKLSIEARPRQTE